MLTNTFHYQLNVLQQNCEQKYFACKDLKMRNVHPCSNGLVNYYVKNARCLNKQQGYTKMNARNRIQFVLCFFKYGFSCNIYKRLFIHSMHNMSSWWVYNGSTFSTHIKYSITLFSCVSHYVQCFLRNLRVIVISSKLVFFTLIHYVRSQMLYLPFSYRY